MCEPRDYSGVTGADLSGHWILCGRRPWKSNEECTWVMQQFPHLIRKREIGWGILCFVTFPWTQIIVQTRELTHNQKSISTKMYFDHDKNKHYYIAATLACKRFKIFLGFCGLIRQKGIKRKLTIRIWCISNKVLFGYIVRWPAFLTLWQIDKELLILCKHFMHWEIKQNIEGYFMCKKKHFSLDLKKKTLKLSSHADFFMNILYFAWLIPITLNNAAKKVFNFIQVWSFLPQTYYVTFILGVLTFDHKRLWYSCFTSQPILAVVVRIVLVDAMNTRKSVTFA